MNRFLVLAPALYAGLSLQASANEALPDLAQISAARTAEMICDRVITSEQVMSFWLDRIKSGDIYNAFAVIDEERALAEARAVDESLDKGEACRPMSGVPIAIKDNIQVKGFPNSGGTKALANFYPETNAEIINKIEESGAIIVGKTTLHEMAFGCTGYNLNYENATGFGVRNAFDTSRIAGGSSAGSAAALGARLIPVAMGTDTGGSTRQPCALNGCLGFRPSVGRYSQEGVIPVSSSRDTPGPMANTVEDIILLDSIITGVEAVTPPAPATIKLGVPEYFWSDLHPEVEATTKRAMEKLRIAGVQLVPVKLSGIENFTTSFGMPIAIYEAQKTIPEYLEKQNTGQTIESLVAQIASPDVKATFNNFVIPGMMPGKNGDSIPVAPVYKQAIEVEVPKLLAKFKKAFLSNDIDALIFPTTPDIAAIANEEAGSQFMRQIRNAEPGSNIGLPGLSIPVGLSDQSKLPVGLEIDGLPGDDEKLLSIARTLEAIWK